MQGREKLAALPATAHSVASASCGRLPRPDVRSHLQRTLGNQAIQALARWEVVRPELLGGSKQEEQEAEAERAGEHDRYGLGGGVVRRDCPVCSAGTSVCPTCTDEANLAHGVGAAADARAWRMPDPSSGIGTPGDPGLIQARLVVSQPGDPEEVEAERIAEKAVSTGSLDSLRSTGAASPEVETPCPRCENQPRLHSRATRGPGTHAGLISPSPLGQSRGSGQFLPAHIRAFFEARLGTDFSLVRVHTDTHAQESARTLQARAFAHGHHLAFAPGEYAPETLTGRRLLAHELVHVQQQEQRESNNPAGAIQRQATPSTTPGSGGSPPTAPPQARPGADNRPSTTASDTKPKVLKPPAPKGELVVHAETNVTFSENVEYVRFQLQAFVAVHGSNRLGVFEAGLYRFGSGLGPFLDPPAKPASPERSGYLNRVVKLVQSEVKTLRFKMRDFMSDFERRAVDKLLEMLDASKARVEKERQRYDVRREGEGFSVETGKETEDLTRRARDLQIKQVAVVAAKAALEQAQPHGPHGELPSGGAPKQEEQNKETSARKAFVEAQRVYSLARAAAERRHPILLGYRLDPLGPITAETLAKLGSTSSATQAGTLAAEIGKTIDNIETLRRDVLAEHHKVWELTAVVEATRTYRDIDNYPGLQAGVRNALLAEKAGELQAKTALTSIFTSIALVIVGLIAAVPTGGLSIGAAAVVAGAGVLEAGLMAFTAYQATEKFLFELAASGTDYDKARAISQEEPSLFWLALDIIGAVVAVPKGLTAFRRLLALRRMTVAAKVAGELSEAEKLATAIRKEAEEIGRPEIAGRLTKEADEIAAARVKHAPEFEEIQRNLSKRRPSTLAGYSEEIPIDGEGNHLWRKSSKGWCRFSDVPLNCFEAGTIEGTALEEQLHLFELEDTAREQLRKNLGAKPKLPGEWQAHHVIPVELHDHEVLVFLRERTGWDINVVENGVWLPEAAEGPLKGKVASHLGSHPAYTSSIEARLEQLVPRKQMVEAGHLTAGELRAEVEGIMAEYRAKMVTEFKGVALR